MSQGVVTEVSVFGSGWAQAGPGPVQPEAAAAPGHVPVTHVTVEGGSL
jgi:hypothetical protein